MSDGETHGEASERLEAMARAHNEQADRLSRETAAMHFAADLFAFSLELMARAALAKLGGSFSGDAAADGHALADELWSELRARSSPPWQR